MQHVDAVSKQSTAIVACCGCVSVHRKSFKKCEAEIRRSEGVLSVEIVNVLISVHCLCGMQMLESEQSTTIIAC